MLTHFFYNILLLLKFVVVNMNAPDTHVRINAPLVIHSQEQLGKCLVTSFVCLVVGFVIFLLVYFCFMNILFIFFIFLFFCHR